MKVSLHAGRSKSLKHNDHRFSSEHIDESRKKDNLILYAKIDGEPAGKTSEETIVAVYKDLYGEAIDAQNEKYRKKRQYGYVKTAEDWAKAPRYAPREEILQIGNKDDKVSRSVLATCYNEFFSWKNEQFKGHYKRLTASLHADEASLHVHELATWFYVDTDGVRKPGLAKALAQVGVPLPDPSKPASKTNCRAMTYTAMCREKWQTICKQHGLQIDVTPDPEAKHQSTEQFKARKQAEEALEQRKAELEKEYQQKAEALKQKLEAEYKQKADELAEWYADALKVAKYKYYSENSELIELGKEYRAIKDAERVSERIQTQAESGLQKEW